MLNDIFSSVLPNTTASTFALGPFLACTAVSLILGLVIAWAHAYRSSCNRGLVLTLALLPAMVQVVIMLVNGNLGTGVAVMGAFSLVRFRSVPGGAKEISSIFLAMAVGLATGTGYLAIAVLFTVLLCLVSLLLAATNFGKGQPGDRILRMTVPEGLDYEGAFDDLFEAYTQSWDLESVRTSNMGSLYRLSYRIVLKKDAKEKAFLDDLRCRNGNLEIACSKIATREELL